MNEIKKVLANVNQSLSSNEQQIARNNIDVYSKTEVDNAISQASTVGITEVSHDSNFTGKGTVEEPLALNYSPSNVQYSDSATAADKSIADLYIAYGRVTPSLGGYKMTISNANGATGTFTMVPTTFEGVPLFVTGGGVRQYVANKSVLVDVAQNLTDAEKTQACDNIGVTQTYGAKLSIADLSNDNTWHAIGNIGGAVLLVKLDQYSMMSIGLRYLGSGTSSTYSFSGTKFSSTDNSIKQLQSSGTYTYAGSVLDSFTSAESSKSATDSVNVVIDGILWFDLDTANTKKLFKLQIIKYAGIIEFISIPVINQGA